MAENITTLLDKLELLAANAANDDKIYIIHGNGPDRDKFMTVAELRKLIGGAAGDVTVTSVTFTDGTSTYELHLDGDCIKSYAGLILDNDSYTISIKGSSSSGGGIQFISGSTPASHAYIEYDSTSMVLSIGATGGVVFGSKIFATGGLESDSVNTDEVLPSTSNVTPVSVGHSSGGVVLNGTAKVDSIAPKTENATVSVSSLLSAYNLPTDFVSVDGIPQTSVEAITDACKPLLEMRYWAVGKVKRFLNSTANDIVIVLFAANGVAYSVTVPALSYVSLCCNGTVTIDGKNYAVCYRGA